MLHSDVKNRAAVPEKDLFWSVVGLRDVSDSNVAICAASYKLILDVEVSTDTEDGLRVLQFVFKLEFILLKT